MPYVTTPAMLVAAGVVPAAADEASTLTTSVRALAVPAANSITAG